uniref:NADH-ubiquinone oxidoreductase chain 3 n=1 Tax=Colposcenia aliena TaxID=3101724 RepID=A0AAU8G9D0_9HEMI
MLVLMKFTMIIMTVMTFITTIIIPMITTHKKLNREKMSPFECGFDNISKSRNSFSIQFFTIAMMFLIFDIEISLLLPIPLSTKLISSKTFILSNMILTLALIMGVMLEWKEGSMNWK